MKKKRPGRKQKKAMKAFDAQVRNSISRIRAAGYSLDEKAMRQQYEKICSTAGDIVEEVHNKPDVLNSVQATIPKYLDTILLLSHKYKKLRALPEKNEDVSTLLFKCEQAVTEVLVFLEGVQTRLMSDELLDLDIQLSVLESELEIDKLQEDYF